jgi:hypothetical protein
MVKYTICGSISVADLKHSVSPLACKSVVLRKLLFYFIFNSSTTVRVELTIIKPN